VEDNREPDGERVLDEVVADNVTNVLEGVIAKGTARRADIGRPAAGKTGTSQNWENAWFVGYTPTLSTAVWMGQPHANVAMHNVHGVASVTGGTLPAMIWHDFMAEAVKDVEPLPFARPGKLQSVARKAAAALKAQHERLKERGGIDLGDRRAPEELGPDPRWWTPVPRPAAKAPPAPATTTSTAPAPGSSPTPDFTSPPAQDKPSPSSTTTTRPPREESPVPDVLPVPRR
ncbi:MAG: penicillin-binding transpeptidase domain-containing protein, partial [Actinomycetota bacterium]|nr:penicillin-binding transpeptidase domain-containing protein [Actinomycetota bacterium]